jgi:hypothetical protein
VTGVADREAILILREQDLKRREDCVSQ